MNKAESVGLASIIKTAMLGLWLLAAVISLLIQLLSLFVFDKGITHVEACQEVTQQMSEKDKPIIEAFFDLVVLSPSYTGTNNGKFINAITDFAQALRQRGISMLDTLDARFFSSRNSGVMVFRHAQEIPAQVVRPIELPSP
jgi:hypothetical protein